MQDWLEIAIPVLQILLIVLVAWLLHRLFKRVIQRASDHYEFPNELLMPIHTVVRWLIIAGSVLLILERMGVSASVLWSAFTGFATVGAVAFFAAWSVLSNLFCALLIFTVRPYRIGEYIEVLDSAEKPGAKGRVVDINLLYTTLEDHTHADTPLGAWLQIPNSLMFQRVVRRFHGVPPPAPPEGAAAAAAAGVTAAEITPAVPTTGITSAPVSPVP